MNYDLVLKNAKVISMDEDLSRYDWVAIKDNKIAALGDGTDAPEGDKVIDLKGKAILPGLADCHVHVIIDGLFTDVVDLLKVKDVQEALDLLEEACKNTPEDEWVIGINYVPQTIKEVRYPDRWELDAISHGRKVIIFASTLHGIAVNSKGMPVCNVPEDMEGVEKVDGIPNGLYMCDESAFCAQGNMLASMPDEVLFGYIENCVNRAVSKGVTMMGGLLGQFVAEDKDVKLVMDNKDKLPLTMIEYYQTWDVEKVKALGLPRIGGCLTLDGSLFEYTQANFKPYVDRPELRGFLFHTDDEIYQLVSKAHAVGMQCAFHALGDRAIDQLIYIYDRVIKEQGANGIRHRIEHFATPTQDQIEMAAEMKLILSMQPGPAALFDLPIGGAFEVSLGREGADNWDPYAKIIKAGGFVCSSSDAPIVPVDPIRDIVACVDCPNPVRNVPLTEGIKMSTINGAYAMYLEDRKGSIVVGKDADFAVVNYDPYEVLGTEKFHEMEVEMTIWEGKIVYQK